MIFSPRKFAYSVSARTHSQHDFVLNIGFGRSSTSAFEVGFVKNRFKKLRVGTNSPCLLRLQTRKFLCRKITARFKLNLKTDGLDCKMIFKFWKNVERFHSIRRKQGRRIYNVCICKQCFRLYKNTFALQNACWEYPGPWTAPFRCRLKKELGTLFLMEDRT